MNRTQEREQVFVIIFEKIFRDESIDDLIEFAKESRDFVDNDYINDVAKGVYNNLEEIDMLISDNSKGWSINRISKVCLAAMRLAIYEILHREDIPVSVSINEAVELIKKYATTDDSAFANGILGTIARNIE
ncbi:MAG: transcription antitermination factor NusB [Acutalibacteraceae bacterium]|nr:transcription antitermination factor NusB [Acutalibacteraceae bacterium]